GAAGRRADDLGAAAGAPGGRRGSGERQSSLSKTGLQVEHAEATVNECSSGEGALDLPAEGADAAAEQSSSGESLPELQVKVEGEHRDLRPRAPRRRLVLAAPKVGRDCSPSLILPLVLRPPLNCLLIVAPLSLSTLPSSPVLQEAGPQLHPPREH
ncbi:unnamed protein product, partial [Prorocentrum cordatum]